MFKDKKEFMDKLFAEMVKGFGIPKKESYPYDEVYTIIDQLKNRTAGTVQKTIGDYIESAQKEYESEKSELDSNKTDLQKELEDKISTLTSELSNKEEEVKNLTNKLDETNSKLIPYTQKEQAKSAEELLKGQVLSGAEVDTFNLIKEDIEGLEIPEDATLEERQELIKPLVEKITESKPYLKAVEETVVNKGILTETKGKVETKPKVTESDVIIKNGIAA